MIVEYDPESAILKKSNAFDSELEGLYLDEPLADNNIGSPNTRSIGGRTEEPGVTK